MCGGTQPGFEYLRLFPVENVDVGAFGQHARYRGLGDMNTKVVETLGFELGAVDYIAKPVKPAILKARVGTHLALREKVEIERKLVKLREDVSRITQHDLKAPLNAIINAPKLIRKDDLTEHQQKLLGMIKFH